MTSWVHESVAFRWPCDGPGRQIQWLHNLGSQQFARQRSLFQMRSWKSICAMFYAKKNTWCLSQYILMFWKYVPGIQRVCLCQYMYTYYILQPFVACQSRESAWDRNGFFCHSNLVNLPKTQLHQERFLLQPPLVESECRGTQFVWGREPSRPLRKNSWSISNPPSWKMMSSLQAITMCW